jgi:hypothetical protein
MNAFQGAPAQYKPSTDPNNMQRYPTNDPTGLTTQERQRRIHEEIAMMRGAQAKMIDLPGGLEFTETAKTRAV